MPDITMCSNKKCKLKNTCYRYKATPDVYQSYCCFQLTKKDNKYSCEYYRKMKENQKNLKKRLKEKGL